MTLYRPLDDPLDEDEAVMAVYIDMLFDYWIEEDLKKEPQ